MSETKKKKPQSRGRQSDRFINTARALGIDESEDGQERAFGKVGMKKSNPKKKSGSKSNT